MMESRKVSDVVRMLRHAVEIRETSIPHLQEARQMACDYNAEIRDELAAAGRVAAEDRAWRRQNAGWLVIQQSRTEDGRRVGSLTIVDGSPVEAAYQRAVATGQAQEVFVDRELILRVSVEAAGIEESDTLRVAGRYPTEREAHEGSDEIIASLF